MKFVEEIEKLSIRLYNVRMNQLVYYFYDYHLEPLLKAKKYLSILWYAR
jgi:hypothetical protein